MEGVEKQFSGNLTKRQRRLLRKEERLKTAQSIHRRRLRAKYLMAGFFIIIVVGAIFVFSKKQPIEPQRDYSLSDPYLGPEDARVVIEEYSDFQCSACKVAGLVADSIIEKYGDKVRLVFNDFPLESHPNAFTAAEAAQCAYNLDAFWEYHDVLFEKQSEWSGESDPKEIFFEYAKDLGLDEIVFSSCLDSRQSEDAVRSDISEGKERRIDATPTFFINGERVVGAEQLDNSQELIDSLLSGSG